MSTPDPAPFGGIATTRRSEAAAGPAAEPSHGELLRGYLFWGVVIGAILLVELAGALAHWLDKHVGITIPWTTISGMIGHLEELWPATAVVVVAVIAPVAVYALGPSTPGRHSPLRRWLRPPGSVEITRWYGAGLALALSALTGFVGVALFDDDFHRAYVIYLALFVFGIVVPSLLPSVLHRKAGFTSLFVTLQHLRRRRDALAMVATVAISGGLAILIVHLAFYPWPDITKEPIRYAGRSAKGARDAAVAKVKALRPQGGLLYSAQARQVVNGKEAWVVFFLGAGDADSGCSVILKKESIEAAPSCSE